MSFELLFSIKDERKKNKIFRKTLENWFKNENVDDVDLLLDETLVKIEDLTDEDLNAAEKFRIQFKMEHLKLISKLLDVI